MGYSTIEGCIRQSTNSPIMDDFDAGFRQGMLSERKNMVELIKQLQKDIAIVDLEDHPYHSILDDALEIIKAGRYSCK